MPLKQLLNLALTFALALCPKPGAADVHLYLLVTKLSAEIATVANISMACQAEKMKPLTLD